MELLTGHPEHLAELETVYVGTDRRPYSLESVRLHQKVALMKLQGCDSRNAAEELRGELVAIAVEDAVPLVEGEAYEYQVEGLLVVTDEGRQLGEIVEVLSVPGANDVFVVHGPTGEILIPAIEDVVKEFDLEAGRVVIHPLPGLLDAA